MLYTNLLPILIGDGSFCAERIGFEGDAIPEGGPGKGAFLHLGAWYHWVVKGSGNVEVVSILPWEVPGPARALVLELLAEILTPRYKPTISAEGCLLLPALKTGEAAFRLDVLIDDHKKQLLITLGAVDTPDHVAQVRQVLQFGREVLQGLKLGGRDLEIGGFLEDIDGQWAEKPLVFSVDGMQHHASAKDGLATFGPYSKRNFTEAAMLLVVVARADARGRASSFAGNLKDGFRDLHSAKSVWGQGFGRAFWVDAVKFVELEFDEAQGTEALRRAIRHLGTNPDTPISVLYFDEKANPALEAHLLRDGLPTHFVAIAELDLTEEQQAERMLDHALALYAKAGGVPWLLTQGNQMEHELVIGIGSLEGDDGVSGFATVFGSQGNYRLGAVDHHGDRSSWEASVVGFTLRQIKDLEEKDGWADGADLSVLFHLDARLPMRVRDEIRTRIKEEYACAYRIRLSFVLMEDAHPYRWWNSDAPIFGQGTLKPSEVIPQRGSYLRLDRKKMLLQLWGPKARGAFTLPIQLELLEGHEHEDLVYLAQQVFYFSKLSWRSVIAAGWPVTLVYGRLVAEKVEALKKADPGFFIPESLKSIPWYL